MTRALAGIYGQTHKAGPGGWITDYDPARGMQVQMAQKQQEMAQEQWAWQKRAYKQEAAARRQAGGTMSRLVSQYNQAYQQAKAANLQRYQEMLGVVGQTTGQRAADIRSSYAGQAATGMQQLARQGMAGTTVAPTMRMGYQREQESALNRLADQMQGTRLGIMERRQDVYPDPNVLVSLAQAIGQSGGRGPYGALSGMRMT